MNRDQTIQTGNVNRRFLKRGPESLAILALASSVFGVWVLQFDKLNLISLMVVVSLFVLGIALRRGWGIYLLFATLIFLKFSLAQYQQVRFIDETDLVYACVAMVFAGCCFRYLQLSQFVRALYPAGERDATQDRFQFPSFFGGRWWLIPFSVFSAASILWWIPVNSTLARRFWITPNGARLIILTFVLCFFWFVCRAVLSIADRWRIQPEQAEVRVRSLIANEFWREQTMIESRRAKARMRTKQPQ